MRCRDCGYTLWGIATGRCPECDAAFKPSDYRFRPRGVSFLCPHCRASYAGTSDIGHLEPSSFDCVKCGAAISMDEMALEPAPDVAESDTLLAPNPWIDRARMGRVKAFLKTIVNILFDPAQFMLSIIDRNPADGTLRDAAFFFATMIAIALFIMMIFGGAIATLIMMFLPARVAGVLAIALPSSIITVTMLFLVAMPLLQGLAGHLGLMVADARRGGLTRTMQCMMYSAGAMIPVSAVLAFVPLGGLVAFGWQCWVLTVLFREAHRSNTGRAAAGTVAAMALPVMLIGSVIGLFVLGIYTSASQRAARQMPPVAVESSATVAGDAIAQALASRQVDSGQLPATPLELVVDGSISPQAFLRTIGRDDAGNDAVVGTLTANDIRTRGDRLRDEAKKLSELRATDESPFRIGQAVFTYRMSGGDADDWMIVELPTKEGGDYQVFRALGGAFTIKPDKFDAELEKLNAARRKRLMAKMPDPRAAPELELSKK